MIDFSEQAPQSPLTITLRTLRAQHEGAEILVGIVLESGERREQKNLLLSVEQYYELKPTRGVITEEYYERLEEASTLCRAIRCGENLLSYGANTRQMLAQKIVRHGFRRDVATEAAQKLMERGLIDEKGDLGRETEKCLRKLWGKKRIESHLWSRGFGREEMAGLSELLEDVDFEKNCATLIEKHYGEPPIEPDARRRMMASLSRYGYSLGEIRAAISRLEKD